MSPLKSATPVGCQGAGDSRIVLTPGTRGEAAGEEGREAGAVPCGVIFRMRRVPVAATYTTPAASTAKPRQYAAGVSAGASLIASLPTKLLAIVETSPASVIFRMAMSL